MEIIKKKISLECFKSRIPALVEIIDGEVVSQTDGTWGKIPKNINHSIFNRSFTFEEFTELYKKLLDVVVNASYYEYDSDDNKWFKIDFDWRNIYSNKNSNVKYFSSLPANGSENCIYGLTTNDGAIVYNDTVSELTNGEYDGRQVITVMNSIIGREIVPPTTVCKNCGHSKIGYDINYCEKCNSERVTDIQEIHVPYFIYYTEINDRITLLEDLKNDAYNCCNKKLYDRYGGNAFLEYLKGIKESESSSWNDRLKRWEVYSCSGDSPTITVPILLTSKLLDLGQYKTYDVDILDENGDSSDESFSDDMYAITGATTVVKTTGESKLKTLRKRKRSFDDNSKELPGILTVNNNIYTINLPYEVGYVKNIKIVNNDIYGDTIVSMKETPIISEITESTYETFASNEQNISFCKAGTATAPLSTDLVASSTKEIGSANRPFNTVITEMNEDILKKTNSLVSGLISYVYSNYPSTMIAKQEYKYDYNLKFKNDNNTSGTSAYTVTGSVFAGVSKSEMEIVYVLGAKMKKSNNMIVIDSSIDSNPFGMSDALSIWKGCGVWYKEIYPLKKLCSDTFLIDGKNVTISYDEIDFNSKEIVYDFQGIDFPRKKYILCEEVMYKTMAYKEYATNDAIFKDETMMGINYPLSESYDIVIDRGNVAAFEKHIQLSDLKTWEDLENYRNGIFLNK